MNANTVTKSLTTNTGGYGGRGITVGTGTASSALTISNNVVYGVNGSNFSGFSNSSAMGIAIGMIGNSSTITTTAGGIGLFYNSVNMTGSMGSRIDQRDHDRFLCRLWRERARCPGQRPRQHPGRDQHDPEELCDLLGRGQHRLHDHQLQRLFRKQLVQRGLGHPRQYWCIDRTNLAGIQLGFGGKC